MAELKWTLVPDAEQASWIFGENDPGTIAITASGERLLVGDINGDGGVCGCCNRRDVVVAYSEPIDYRSIPGPDKDIQTS